MNEVVEKHYQETAPFDFTYRSAERCLWLIFEPQVYASAFFQYGDAIQKATESGLYESKPFDELVINLEHTDWFDSLALAYLMLFLYDAKNKRDIKLRFEGPQDSTFFAFLVDNGFYAHMRELEGLPGEVQYEFDRYYSSIHSCLYPFHVLQSRGESSDLISDVCGKIGRDYKDSLEEERLKYIINKLSYFLEETIENVYSHAYEGKEGLCGILIKTVTCMDEREKYRYRKLHMSMTPYSGIYLYDDLIDFLEIYVLDVGIGLKKSIMSHPEYAGKVFQDSDIIGVALSGGEQSYRKVKDTIVGGLYDIHDLFQKDGDGLGIKGDTTWWFSYGKRGPNQNRINRETRHGSYTNLIHGFALVGAIQLRTQKQGEMPHVNVGNILSEENKAKIFFSKNDNFDTFEKFKEEYSFNGEKAEEMRESYCPYRYAFLEEYVSKNEILEVLKSNADTVVFLGVKNSEIKKYESTIKNTNPLSFHDNTTMILIVSESANLYCYQREREGVPFILNDESATSIIQESYVSGVPSSYTFWNVLEKHLSSELLWKTIEEKYDSFYINRRVLWNNGVPELHGYLDFSRLCRVSECRELLIRRMASLRALFPKAYFQSMDRFTDEVCEQANHVLKSKTDGIPVYIGSVYVSGTSRRMIEDADRCFYFLCHPDAVGKENIQTLFYWSQKDRYCGGSLKEDGANVYERLGDSSFVSLGGIDYCLKMHFNQPVKEYPLSIDSFYEIIQRQVGVHPSTLRIAHYRCSEKHDLFGYRLNYLFDTDIIKRIQSKNTEKKSVFDFLFVQFIKALFPQNVEFEESDILAESLTGRKREALSSKLKGALKSCKNERKGLILYSSDYQTEYLVEQVKVLFSNKIGERIIPLIPMSHEYEAGTLIISPLILDTVGEMLERSGPETDITVFVSEAHNVRLIEEIKQIMYGMGACKVRVLTLLDRRRLSAREKQSSLTSFGRSDIPGLHVDGGCVICNALELLSKASERIINAGISERVEKIKKKWEQIRLSDQDYGKGVNTKRIELSAAAKKTVKDYIGKCSSEEIVLSTNSALCSAVLEYTTVTSSTDFLIELLDETILLDPEKQKEIDESTVNLKLLLASSYLILFYKSRVSSKQVRKIVERLCSMLDSCLSESDEAGLAIISLCGLESQFLVNALTCIERIERESKPMDGRMIGIDGIIARIVTYVGVYGSESPAHESILDKRVRCYLKGNNSKTQSLYDAFLFTEIESGKSHKYAFANIMGSETVPDQIYKDACDYIDKLDFLLKDDETYHMLFHDKESFISSVPDVKDKLKALKGQIVKCLETKVANRTNTMIEEIRESVSLLVNGLHRMQTPGLYLRTCDSSEDVCAIQNWLEYCKKKAVERVEKRDNFQLLMIIPERPQDAYTPKNHVRPWFYSFADVTEEAINLMGDMMKYSDGIKICQNGENGILQYDGIVEITFQESFVEIAFKNASKGGKAIEEIRITKNSKKDRETMLVFRELEAKIANAGGTLGCFSWEYTENVQRDFMIEPGKIYKATMRIPYISR